MLKDSRFADLESANAEYQRQLTEAEERISFLEKSLKASSERTAVPVPVPPPAPPQTEAEKTIQLLDLKAQALELRNDLENNLRHLESTGTGGSGAK
jgi:hypothetical protein